MVKGNCRLKATAAAGLKRHPSAEQQAAGAATTNRLLVPSVPESIVTLHVCGEADKLLKHCTCLTVTGVLLLSLPLL